MVSFTFGRQVGKFQSVEKQYHKTQYRGLDSQSAVVSRETEWSTVISDQSIEMETHEIGKGAADGRLSSR
jgi:hypothetical protein